MGKIKIGRQRIWDYHRSGWSYALSALRDLHSDRGVLFDGFIEEKFVWPGTKGWPPYREPWIGFFHTPPYVPPWFGPKLSAEDLITTTLWRESIPFCRGLFTLSSYLSDWLRPRVPVEVCNLFHPTDHCAEQFSMEKYCNNQISAYDRAEYS
jgi:hypothetical protein